MKFLLLLCAVVATAGAQTNDVTKVTVTGDRVSMRAIPSLEGELLDRAMRGDEMVYFEKTNGWVAVQAPDTLSFWVAAQYIDVSAENPESGVVTPKKLNIRSGPSRNYNVMAEVLRDDVVSIRGEFPPPAPREEGAELVAAAPAQDESKRWFKIAPPTGSRVWISEDYVEIVEPAKPEPVVEEEKPEPVVEEEKPESVVEEEQKPLLLVIDKTKPQGKVEKYPGILRRATPGLYKLVLIVGDLEEPICLIRGREGQLDKLLNRSVLIEGPVYWAKDVDLPVIEPRKISKDPIISE